MAPQSQAEDDGAADTQALFSEREMSQPRLASWQPARASLLPVLLASGAAACLAVLRLGHGRAAQVGDAGSVMGANQLALSTGQFEQLYARNYKGKGGMWCVGLNAVGFDLAATAGRQSKGFKMPDKKAIKHFHDQGSNCFRLPMTWERMQSKLGSEELDLIDGIESTVEYITKELGDHVIIDPHNNDQGLQYDGKDVTEQDFVNLWKAVSKKWGSNSKCVFALYNEPRNGYANGKHHFFDPDDLDRDGKIVEAWRHWMQSAIDVIRAAGSKSVITVPGLHWTSTGSWSGAGWWGETLDGRPNAGNSRLAALVDPENLVAYDVHTYMDEKFTGELDGCGGHDTSFWCKGYPDCKGADYGLELAIEWAKLYKKKLIVTEIGSWPGKDGSHDICKGKMAAHLRRMRNSGVFIGYTIWQFGCDQCDGDQYTMSNPNLDWYGFEHYSGHCADSPCFGGEQRHIRWKTHPHMCLGAEELKEENGANLHLWECKEDRMQQQFLLPKVGKPGTIKWAKLPSMCLDVSKGLSKNGNNIQLWKCDDDHANMQFELREGESNIRWAKHPDKCLDISGGKLDDGTNIQIWDCNIHNEYQHFLFPMGDLTEDGLAPDNGEGDSFDDGNLEDDGKVETETQFVGSIGWGPRPSKCLDVSAGGTKNGNTIQLWDCIVDARNQVFLLPKGDGPIRWKENPHKCLDIAGGVAKSGTDLQIWDCGDGKHENFQFRVPERGSTAPIRWATHPEWCLDIANGKGTNGNNVQIWHCGNGKHKNMQFSV